MSSCPTGKYHPGNGAFFRRWSPSARSPMFGTRHVSHDVAHCTSRGLSAIAGLLLLVCTTHVHCCYVTHQQTAVGLQRPFVSSLVHCDNVVAPGWEEWYRWQKICKNLTSVAITSGSLEPRRPSRARSANTRQPAGRTRRPATGCTRQTSDRQTYKQTSDSIIA